MTVDGETGYLAPDLVLKALINKDDRLIGLLRQNEMKIKTSLFALYEAFSCIEEEDDFDIAMFKKLMEKAEIDHFEEVWNDYDLTVSKERKEELRERVK